jgi:CheY-like chemotaxis protein
VLVVDDNETNRIIVSKYLQAWGCDCQQADSADQAMNRLQEAAEAGTPFDAAVLDRLMPETDGEQLAERIQACPSLGRPRLILLSSSLQRGDNHRLTEAGFSCCLAKPIRQSALYNALQSALGSGETCSPAPADDSSEAGTSLAPGLRVLVAEDNVVNQKMALQLLSKKLDLRADAVANGIEVLEALRRIDYDAVLMDCQMPEMDGYEATRRIRGGQSGVRNPAVRIIAMTANAMAGDREVCIEAGMDDYIAKPIRLDELRDALVRNLPESRPQSSPRR